MYVRICISPQTAEYRYLQYHINIVPSAVHPEELVMYQIPFLVWQFWEDATLVLHYLYAWCWFLLHHTYMEYIAEWTVGTNCFNNSRATSIVTSTSPFSFVEM